MEIPHGDFPHFRMSAAFGHTYLPKDTRVGRDVAVLPTINLDLEYWFSHRVGIGFHNDLELLNFQVRDQEDDLIIERDYPVLITFDVIYRLFKGLTIYAGPGVEFEKNEDYFVTRLGLEYEIEIRRGWDVHPVLFHDFRRNAYNTTSIGVGFGKRF
ncbi:MAG: hypothetical protein P8X57_07210 [Cyclobacteriaceae bacterium]